MIFFIGTNKMVFQGELGKGTYARVVKVCLDNDTTVVKALKIQKPSCPWEWYINKEIQHRLQDSEKVKHVKNIYYLYIYMY